MNDAHEVVDLNGEALSRRYFKDANGIMDGNKPYSGGPCYCYGDTEITRQANPGQVVLYR